jgi:hypothetical protein
MSTVSLAGGGKVSFDGLRGRNVFLYLVRGDIRIAGEHARQHHLIALSDEGDSVDIEADGDALLLFGHAAPLNEPVVAHGPFVMNSREEIQQAVRDYMDGKFGGAL